MNYHPIIDRMKTIADLLPNIGGGGGGTSYPYLTEYEEITVVSGIANTKEFSDLYIPDMDPQGNPYPLILCIINNTHNVTYAGNTASRLSTIFPGRQNQTKRYFVRNNSITDVVGNDYTFTVGAGSTIYRYVWEAV